MILITSVLLIISINNLYKYLQIMQQQFYSIKRFIKVVIKENDVYEFIMLLLSLMVFIIGNIYIYYLYLLILVVYYFPRIKNSIIKLKFTKRVIRTYVMEIISIMLLGVLISIIPIYIRSILIGFYVMFFKYIFIIFFVIESIIEHIINKTYIKKAKRKLEKYKPKIIAITGSFGKTSSKEYLYKVMSKYYKVIATPKSYNTVLGITSFINNSLNDYYEYIILEVGVDCKNGMNKFLKLFTPDISIVTGIAPQHLSTFKSIDNIKKEKMKLAYSTKDKAFINKEFIKDENENFIYYQSNEIVFDINGFYYENEYYSTSLFGEHLYINLLLVIKVSTYLNIPSKIIKENIKKITNAKHRFECTKRDNTWIVDDSYNSNYYSFSKAIESINKINKYKIIITPGLIELGNDAYKYNTLIAKKCLEVFDKIYLVGNNFAFKEILKSTDKLETFSNFNDAFLEAKKSESDKVILIENDLPDVYIE